MASEFLNKAICIASNAHQGQVDKAGAPYILHPLRIMMRGKDIEEQIVGVLHDTIEDTDIDSDYLRNEGFSDKVLFALQCMTKQKGEDYSVYIHRVLMSPLATRVKLYDLEDNMRRDRIPNPTEKDLQRFEKYKKYHAFLSECI